MKMDFQASFILAPLLVAFITGQLPTVSSGDIQYNRDHSRIQHNPYIQDAQLRQQSTLAQSKRPKRRHMDELDPIFNEVLDEDFKKNTTKRGAVELYKMIKCGTGCNPLIYKGYGCYCGFLGSGGTVDGIDRCCKMHDWCYSKAKCKFIDSQLPYFVGFKWTCNHGAPYCVTGKSRKNGGGSCGHQLCECDREFVECLKEYPCPSKKAMCRSPWRYWQNLFMGLGTGMEVADVNSIHGPPHPMKPRPLIDIPQPKFYKKRLQFELL